MNDAIVFNFSTFPVLTTERLALRRVLLSDAADMLVFRGDGEVQKYNGPVFQDVDDVKTFFEELHAEYAAQMGVNWAVTLAGNNTVLGLFGFHHWNQFHRRAEVGLTWRVPIGDRELHPRRCGPLFALASNR